MFIPGGEGPGLLGSLVLGAVEGLTEFLPVSSTGHLIVANRLLGGEDPAYEVAIQAGAITAIAVVYRAKLWTAAKRLFARGEGATSNLLVLLVVAAVPAAVAGLLLDHWITSLLFNPTTVGLTLLIGGVALLWIERWLAKREAAGDPPRHEVEAMTLRQAIVIGLFQCLALVPGTSRSGATIAGGLLIGFRRAAAAEFSFLVGLPILYGACSLKIAEHWERMTGPLATDLLVGSVASFATALVVVGPFVRFLQKHTFVPFGWYRIVAGAAILALAASGVLG